jgi:argininosuccinate lyase
MGETVNLEMLAKLVRDIQAEQKTMRAEMQQGFAALTQKVDAQSTTLVTMRRDIHSLQGDVAVALSALDDHTRRLALIEKPGDDQPHA